MSRNLAYMAPLVTLPTIIDKAGRYVTRRGETVMVDAVSARYRAEFGCSGRYENGVSEAWHKSGRLLAGTETLNDIVRAA